MNDVEAGRAHITTYVENSKFFQGLKAAEKGFKDFGGKLVSIGSKLTGVGDAIGLTMGKEFTGKFLKVVAGATLGAAIAAPLGQALGKIINSGAANGLIVELIQLRDSIAGVIEVMATALLPPLRLASRVVAGIVGGVNRWIVGNQALIVMAANIVTTIGSVGAILAIIGTTVSFIGSGFAVLTSVISTVTAVLATPLGLTLAIGAAIAAGVVAWVRFTASGKAAAQFLYDVFSPTLAVISETLGGLGNALTAGNLQLAGQIAVTALQLLFQQGVDSIAELLGGVLGAAIGDIGTRLIAGDLKGAWDSTVAGMGALWASFSSGVVEVFSAAANAVIGAWEKVSKKVSDTLLETAAGGGFLGSVMKEILGVDVAEEIRKNNEFDRQRGIKQQDVLGDAKNSARDQISGQAAMAKDWVAQLRKQAEANGIAAVSNHADRLAAAPTGTARERELQNRLDGLTKQAAKEAAGIKDIALPDKQQLGAVSVGFSGAALALQLQGGSQNPQREMLGELKKNKDLLAEAVGLLKKIKDKAAALGITD